MNRLGNLMRTRKVMYPALAAAAGAAAVVFLVAGVLATLSIGTTRKDGWFYGK